MTNLSKICLLAATIGTLASCSVVRTSTSKRLDTYDTGIVQAPLLVDLDIKGERVRGSASGSTVAGIDTWKAAAVAAAAKDANADVLVEARFNISSSFGWFGTTTVDVTGYPATYKNFRPLKADDLKLLNYESHGGPNTDTKIIPVNYAKTNVVDGNPVKRKSSKLKAILLGALAVFTVITLIR